MFNFIKHLWNPPVSKLREISLAEAQVDLHNAEKILEDYSVGVPKLRARVRRLEREILLSSPQPQVELECQ